MTRPFDSLRTPLLGLVALALVSGLGASPTQAQFGATFGEIFFSDVEGDGLQHTTPPPFAIFDIWVMQRIDFADAGFPPDRNEVDGMLGWEASFDVPAGITVANRELIPVTSINVAPTADNFIVGTGVNVLANTSPFATVRYQCLLLTTTPPEDMVITIGPATPASFDSPTPVWLSFLERELHQYEKWESNRFVVNCVNEPECLEATAVTVQVGDRTVETGVVDVPVSVYLSPQKVGDPARIAGLDLEIAWDPTLADLDDVLTTSSTAGWLVEFQASPGVADISMASLNTVAAQPLPAMLEMLRLRFDSPGTPGQTSLSITDVQLFDLDQNPIAVDPIDGSLTTGCDKGDVTMDGSINSADAIRALLIAFDLLTPTPAEFCAADMDDDTEITTGDVILILQAAVGLLPARGSDNFKPSLFVRTTPEVGGVSLQLENMAGLELTLEFDKDDIAFTSASAPGSNGLTIVNDKTAGRIVVGFAKAELYSGELQLQFEVSDPASPLLLKEAVAYDEFAHKTALDPGLDEIYFGVTAIGDTPDAFGITRAFPNPFNPRTQIDFLLDRPGDAVIQVFDAAGRRVRTLPFTGLSAGSHQVVWDGTNDAGLTVASGSYLVQLTAHDDISTRRVTLLK